MFFASLKLATASSMAPPATNLGAAGAIPAGLGQPMPSAGVSGVDVCGMISIKLGLKTVVDTHGFSVPSNETYESLRIRTLQLHVPTRLDELSGIPATVRTYQNSLCLSTGAAGAIMSDQIGINLGLGYKFVVVTHEPRKDPAPPGANAFAQMDAARMKLPDKCAPAPRCHRAFRAAR